MNTLLLIDGNSIMNRTFYGVPELSNAQGLHINAIHGFMNILLKLMEEDQPTHVAVAFDRKAPTFRHKLFQDYKAGRKPMDPNLSEQMPVIKELLQSFEVSVVEQEGIEADDILGTLAKEGEKKGYSVEVLSGDRDLLQLVTDQIVVKLPKTKAGRTMVEVYTCERVVEDFGVTPAQIVDLKGLMGDSSDNIPGIYGVGEVTAVKLLKEYETVENVLAHKEEITPSRTKNLVLKGEETALLSKDLATIRCDCKLPLTVEDCQADHFYNNQGHGLLKTLGLRQMMVRYEKNMGVTKPSQSLPKQIFTKKADLIQWIEGADSKDLGIVPLMREAEDAKKEEGGQLTLFADPAPKYIGVALAVKAQEEIRTAFVSLEDDIRKEDITSLLEEEVNKGVCLVGNHMKEFYEWIPEDGNIFDTAVAAYLINPLLKDYSEEYLAGNYSDREIFLKEVRFPKKTLDQVYVEGGAEEKEDVVEYLCLAAGISLDAKPALTELLERDGMKKVFEDIEMPLIPVLYRMEKEGILVRRLALKEYGEGLTSRIEELEENIYEMAGEEFNIQSPKQLGTILFEKLHLPGGKKTKTGYSTSADVLNKLRYESPIVDQILEYRTLTKLKSTYAEGLDPYIQEDGRIHTKFNQTVTATGRLSSADPNLQNIPIRMDLGRQIRKVFVPKDGCIFLDADYSQIELRVLAHMSEDEHLIQSYKENADIHQTTASRVFHIPYDEVTELDRRRAKAVNFGIIYGISGFGLSRDLDISRKKAEEYIAEYFATYPKVKSYMDSLVEGGKEKGYVTSLYGRRRPIPELKEKNYMRRQFGERIAMNSPIQGTAADIIKIAMIRVDRELRKRNLKSKLLLQIHDELLIETYEEEEEEVRELLNREMVNAAELSVPLIADVKKGNDWYEAK